MNNRSDLSGIDYRGLITRADLIHDRPAARPVEGHPIGNGRMGTMVWTTGGSVELQINRVDVFAVNRNHLGKRGGPADYCCGCARVSIDIGEEAFSAEGDFEQHLSLYRAECTVRGTGVVVRCLVSAVEDILVLEVEDRRATPKPLQVRVSMLREPKVVTGEHVATSTFPATKRADQVVLTQTFREREHFNASAVAAAIGNARPRVEVTDDSEVRLVAPAVSGKRTVLISSVATWEAADDVAGMAEAILRRCVDKPYDVLRTVHLAWWESFWSGTFVRLDSSDGEAERFERIRTLQLYYMGSSSRGMLPPKWNGSIFSVDRDARSWGAQFWVWTTEISCFPLYAADAIELTDPFFDMYVRQLSRAKEAARQRWDAAGAYFLEAGPFDGPVVLPEEIAREYRDVYLGRKTIHDLSPEARALGQYECVLTQFADGHNFRGVGGRYSFISHTAHSGSSIAAHAWRRYRYTGDTAWLRSHAYPLLRETVEFYRSLASKESDGRYHLLVGLNQFEGHFGTRDGVMDLAAIRGTAPLAIRASEILGVDEELRASWSEFLEHLTPYPMSGDPQTHGVVKDCPVEVWALGFPGDVPHPRYVEELPELILFPVFPFENWTRETRDPATDRIVHTLAELNMFHVGMIKGRWNEAGMNSRLNTPIIDARIGRGETLPTLLTNHQRQYHVLPNGFSLFEGASDHSIEHLGDVGTAINEALLQSVSPHPGEPEIISVFPAWPREWDAEFRLLARGGFLVSARIRGGEISAVRIESRRGEICRFRNYWGRPCSITADASGEEKLEGEILVFDTAPGKSYRIEAR